MNYRIISALLVVFGAAAIIMVISGNTRLDSSPLNKSLTTLTNSSKNNEKIQFISNATENKPTLTTANSLLPPDKDGLTSQLELNKNVNSEHGKVPQKTLPPAKIVRSDEEWRKRLSPDQFYVLREKGTEPPFSGEYNDNHRPGDYYCAACHLKLFSSKAKFDSGTGWPSFYQPLSKQAVIEEIDNEYETPQTEILCSRCNSHLGHVFKDGPKPTGLRYCMNSMALKFEKSI